MSSTAPLAEGSLIATQKLGSCRIERVLAQAPARQEFQGVLEDGTWVRLVLLPEQARHEDRLGLMRQSLYMQRLHELAAQAAFSASIVPRLLEADAQADCPYLVMEWPPG